jgi:hypothetical protein
MTSLIERLEKLIDEHRYQMTRYGTALDVLRELEGKGDKSPKKEPLLSVRRTAAASNEPQAPTISKQVQKILADAPPEGLRPTEIGKQVDMRGRNENGLYASLSYLVKQHVLVKTYDGKYKLKNRPEHAATTAAA